MKSPGASPEALSRHYDIGNDFYRLWLDEPFMSYTCALWEGQADTLEAAQLRKVQYHCREVGARDGMRVLDVGCGWGGLLKHLVGAYTLQRAVGLTLNRAHVEYVAGYADPRIDVRMESWAEHAPADGYDVVFAWGVLEHAVSFDLSPAEKARAYRQFFQTCHGWLKPGGKLSLQTIAYGNMRREDMSRFFVEEVFPESDLPSLGDLAQGSERLFEIARLRNDRADYERTCRAWLGRLKANRAAAVEVVGEDVVARYEKYLKLSIIGFHIGTVCLLRLTMHRL